MAQAYREYHAGRHDAATALCARNLQAHPGDAESLHLLALIQFQRGQVEEAIALLEKAIAAEPNVAALHNNLGSMMQTSGRLSEARACYQSALALQPDYPEALCNYGYLQEQQHCYDVAEQLLRRALALKPAYPEAHNNLGNVLGAQGKLGEAADHFQQAISLRPNYADAYNNLGIIRMGSGEFASAVDCFEKALSFKPAYLEAMNNLGNALLELGHIDKAETLFRQALALQADHPNTVNNLGSALYLRAEFDNAISYYQAAMRINAERIEPVVNIARVYLELGQLPDAYAALSDRFGEDYGASLLAGGRSVHECAQLLKMAISYLIVSWLLGDFTAADRCVANCFPLRRNPPTRDTKNSLVFLNYIQALLLFRREHPELYARAIKTDGSPLGVIGESHALSPCHTAILWQGERRPVFTVFKMGVKMWHLAKSGVSHHRSALEKQLHEAPSHAHLLFTIGEIDCRIDEGIWHVYQNKQIPLSRLIDDTVTGYLDWIARVTAPNNPLSIVIQGVAAPGYPLAGLAGHSAREEFLAMIRAVNQKLMVGAHSRCWGFLDVYGATATDEGVSNRIWHLDDNHLRPDFYEQAQRWLIPYFSDAPVGQASVSGHVGERRNSAPQIQSASSKNENGDVTSVTAFNEGNAHLRAGRFLEALAAYDRALHLDENNIDAIYNQGLVLYELTKIPEAIDAFERAVALRPNSSYFLNALGHACLDGGLPTRAATAFSRFRELEPNNPEALANVAKVLLETGEPEKAMDLNLKAFQEGNGNIKYWENLMLARQYCPTEMLGNFPMAPWLRAKEERPIGNQRKRVVRIGFVSADLNRHPVGLLLLPLLEQLNPEVVQPYCYSTASRFDEISEKIKNHCQWREVRVLGNSELKERIIADQIDVLFDLAGYTRGNRLSLFSQRVAPIQVSWLGYTDTTAVPDMDYVILDRWHVLPAEEQRYSEKIIYFPESRFLFAPASYVPISSPPFLRNRYITFGSFNNTAKLNSEVILVWSRILNAVPESRLVLKWRTFADAEFCKEIANRFQAHGVDPTRLEFRPWSNANEVLEQYGDIDICLDPFPFSGGYTTFEALWMGVPVITLPKTRPISRQGYCLLNNIGLGELCATDAEDYVCIATQLADDQEKLADLRLSLRQRLLGSPLMDAKKFANNFERLLLELCNVEQHVTYNQEKIETMNTPKIRTFLHVGCGPKRKNQTTRGFAGPEWHELRFDIDESVKPDIVGTMLDMSNVQSESVEAIFSSHNIEHLYPHEVPLALKEFLRVLKSEGFLVLTCPDLQSVCQLIVEDKLTDAAYVSPAGPIAPIDILYGHRPQLANGNLYMAHKCGFTEKVLRATLLESGFSGIATMRRGHPCYDIYALATKKPCPDEILRNYAMLHFPVGQK